MSDQNTQIVIASGINCKPDYSQLLNLSQAEMQSLCNSNALYSSSNYMYLKENRNIVRVQCNHNLIKNANYCYINNREFGTDLRFYFINNVSYVSDNATDIELIIDYFSTYKHLIEYCNCFVERQHQDVDTKFSNTQPEPFRVERYSETNATTISVNPLKFKAILSEQWIVGDTYSPPNINYVGNVGKNQYSGTYWIEDLLTDENFDNFAQYYHLGYVSKNKGADLLTLYLKPTDEEINASLILPSTTLNGYKPKNNKLFNYPYCKITMSNNQGSVTDYQPELFLTTQNPQFRCVTADNGKAQAFCYPLNYANKSSDFDGGLLIDNYPCVPMINDSYSAWIGQASAGLKQGVITGAIATTLGVIAAPFTGGLSLLGAGAVAGNLIKQGTEIATHQDTEPDTVVGRADGNIINQALQKFQFSIRHYTANRDMLETIDNYFTRYGYSQNKIQEVKTFNVRFPWHFVKVADGECAIKGALPAEALDILNRAFRSGVTFFNNNNTTIEEGGGNV